jgi:predicted RNase H-like nuclease (RuvC/YqgF family)
MTGTPTPKQEHAAGPSAASKRREANRLAAARFRTRKKDQVTELENRVHDLEAENFHLKAVNRTLRKRCGVADEQVVEVDDEFAAGRPAWRREVAGERFVSERAASEAAAEFMESPTGGDPSKKRRRTGKAGGDPIGYHHLDRSVSASGDADPYVQLQDENDRLQNQMRAYEDRMRNMTDELVGLRYRVREETGNGSEGSDQSPEVRRLCRFSLVFLV